MTKTRKQRNQYNPKHSLARAKWRKDNPDKAKEIARKYRLMSAFGLTIEQYDELLLKQNNCCAVCERPSTDFKSRLHVDHDHKTNEIFGLLCYPCNHRLIGRERDPNKFLKAAKYLQKGTGLFAPEKKKKKRKKR